MAKEPKPSKTITFDRIKSFHQAIGFEIAEMVLAQRAIQTALNGNPEPLSTVVCVNAAFAAELYLKTLQIIDKGRAFQIHELKDLFADLKPEDVPLIVEIGG